MNAYQKRLSPFQESWTLLFSPMLSVDSQYSHQEYEVTGTDAIAAQYVLH